MLAEEERTSQLNTVVKYSLGAAIAAHQAGKQATDETEKEVHAATLLAHIGVITKATGLHETGPIIYKAIVQENQHYIPKLHDMITRIAPADVA